MPVRKVLHVLPHPGEGGERYVDLLEPMDGFSFERVALTEGRGKLEALRGVSAARRAALRADLVHVHGDSAAILCVRILRRQPGVITFHGMHLLRRSRGPMRWLIGADLRRAIRFSRAAICVSASEFDDASAVAGSRGSDRVVRVDNGIPDPEPPDAQVRASVRRELGIGDDEMAVLFVGQLEARKGVLDLIAALELARAQGARAVGLIAGEGPLRESLEQRAGPAGARVLGRRDDVDDLLQAADVFAMPSEREGLSLAVLEAMSRGLALVVSDGPGNPDAVGDAGLISSYGQPGALAGALSKLAGDPALRSRLGEAARARFAARFTAERMVEETRAVYERALDAGDPSRISG